MATPVWLDTLAIPLLGVTLLLLMALVTLGPLVWAAASERGCVRRAPCLLPPADSPTGQPAKSPQVQEVGMVTCIICRVSTELDDVAVRCTGARCVCLRCFAREAGTSRQMPAWLRRALTALLAETPVA